MRWTGFTASLTLLALGGLPCYSAAARSEVPTVDLKIDSEPLGQALQDFAKQSGIQIIFFSQVTEGLKAPALRGQFTVDAALTQLLDDSKLTYRQINPRTIEIRPLAAVNSLAKTDDSGSQEVGSGGRNSAGQEGRKSSSDGFRVAQVDQGQTSGSSTVEKQDEQTSKKKPVQLEEIIVTGSRIPTAAGQQTLPVRNYTREDIENSGQITTGEFLNTLPDVSTFANSLQTGWAGAQTVQLHGLPIGTTLTLLDGRRLDTSYLGFFDLASIPLAAVERIEILPVGASAIYGADGLGGAVNTILRKNFNGFEVNASLEHASDVNNPSGNLAWGKSWERGSVSLIVSYQARDHLLGARREPWSSTSLPVNAPTSTVFALAGDGCTPGNVYSLDGSNLPGLSSPEAAIPARITGVPTIQQFAATAGKQNVCNPLRYRDITPQSQREGALLSAHYEIAESLDLFTEVLLSHRHLQDQIGPQIQVFQGTVAANNPYNPFGEAVNVSFAYPGAGQREVQSTSLIRPLIGVRGSFLSDWHYEATVYLSQDRFHDVNLYTDAQGTLIPAALNSSNPATALDPFTSGAPGTQQLLSSLTDPAANTLDNLFDERVVSGQALLRGPALQLPAGAIQAVVGSEYSQQKQDVTSVIFGGPPYLLTLHRNTYAVFSEARIPLLTGAAPAQGGERLALTLAGRYDHSNDYGGKATWQGGLLWRATDTLSLRGAYGLSYQAPHLSQISGPQSVFVAPLLVPDPFRGNQLISYSVAQVFGPNFNLKPETGDSFTLGLEYSSQTLPGLHTSFTWYQLTIKNYIGTESTQALLAYPNLFPGAVIRGPPTPQDQQQGFLGQIAQINDTFYNYGDLRVAGFDADIRYAIDTRAGQFTPSLALANVYRWQSALLPNTPEMNGVSEATNSVFGGGPGWSPRWKGTAALAWKQGPLSMSLAGRYIGRYLDYQLFVPNTNEIGNTWIFDFNARYELGQTLTSANHWLARSYVAFGAVNLLNKTPPFSYTSAWYDIQQYDIRGRYLYLNAGLRF